MRYTSVLFVAAMTLAAVASAADVKVLASGATREVVSEVIPAFESATGHKVRVTWTGTADIKKRIGTGEVFDLIIVGAPEVDAFTKEGRIVPGTRADLMKSGVGVAVRAGAPKPDIGSADAMKKAILSARSIAYSTGPSGVYVGKMLERMGIADQVKGKTTITKPGVRVGALIANGEVELGLQQISELIHEKGIDYLGPLPPELQNFTLFSSGIHAQGAQPQAAKALVESLRTPAVAAEIRKNGMDPAF